MSLPTSSYPDVDNDPLAFVGLTGRGGQRTFNQLTSAAYGYHPFSGLKWQAAEIEL
jgi:hypothetical protein